MAHAKAWKLALGAMVAASMALSGCAVDSTEGDDEISDSTDDAVTYASLEGTWIGEDGIIYTLTLTKERAETLGGFMKGYRFDATIDTGVRCITTPCDLASTTVSGVYKVKGTKLTLASYDKPSAVFAKILGDYKLATKAKVTKLKLTKDDGTLTENFHKQVGVPCGTNVCGAGTYCCNPVMSICAKVGMMCIMSGS